MRSPWLTIMWLVHHHARFAWRCLGAARISSIVKRAALAGTFAGTLISSVITKCAWNRGTTYSSAPPTNNTHAHYLENLWNMWHKSFERKFCPLHIILSKHLFSQHPPSTNISRRKGANHVCSRSNFFFDALGEDPILKKCVKTPTIGITEVASPLRSPRSSTNTSHFSRKIPDPVVHKRRNGVSVAELPRKSVPCGHLPCCRMQVCVTGISI